MILSLAVFWSSCWVKKHNRHYVYCLLDEPKSLIFQVCFSLQELIGGFKVHSTKTNPSRTWLSSKQGPLKNKRRIRAYKCSNRLLGDFNMKKPAHTEYHKDPDRSEAFVISVAVHPNRNLCKFQWLTGSICYLLQNAVQFTLVLLLCVFDKTWKGCWVLSHSGEFKSMATNHDKCSPILLLLLSVQSSEGTAQAFICESTIYG
jgi:hypothetical protein